MFSASFHLMAWNTNKHRENLRFSLCELFFLLGFFLLMFLNSLKKMQWYVMFEKKLFCEWNPENMYYSFVDQVIKCPICNAILEDGHILRAFAGLFPGKISGTYLEKVAPITTQLNMSQIGSNPANIEHEKSLKSPIHTIQELLKNCQMDEGYCEYIYISIHVYVLKLSMFYLYCILYLLNIKYKHCISYVYIIYIYISTIHSYILPVPCPPLLQPPQKNSTFHTSNFRGTTGESEIAHMKPWV